MERLQDNWTIQAGEVHVWQAGLEGGFDLLGGHTACRSVLSPEERERGAALRFPGGTELYELARGGLRRLLGRYVNVEPAGIRFVYNGYGKPFLDEPGGVGKSWLNFNLSHSHGHVMWAFSREGVGVDLERHREFDDLLPLAERYFAEPERRELRATAEERRLVRFYQFWTLKEAFIKGRGQGLSIPLDSFAMEGAEALGPGRYRVITFDDPQVGAAWSLALLSRKPAGFSAAVAASTSELVVVDRTWPAQW